MTENTNTNKELIDAILKESGYTLSASRIAEILASAPVAAAPAVQLIPCDNDHLVALALAGSLPDKQAAEVLRAAFQRPEPAAQALTHAQIDRIAGGCMDTDRYHRFMRRVNETLAQQAEAAAPAAEPLKLLQDAARAWNNEREHELDEAMERIECFLIDKRAAHPSAKGGTAEASVTYAHAQSFAADYSEIRADEGVYTLTEHDDWIIHNFLIELFEDAPRAAPAVALPAAIPQLDENEALRKLAFRTLWLAYVWNDYNFKDAHLEARATCESLGIHSFDEASVWIESLNNRAALPAAPELPRSEHSYQTDSGSEFASSWKPAYTADQMREYGKACASAVRAAPLFRNVVKVTRSSDQSLTLHFNSTRACSEFEHVAAQQHPKEPT